MPVLKHWRLHHRGPSFGYHESLIATLLCHSAGWDAIPRCRLFKRAYRPRTMSNQLQSGHFFAVVPLRSTWNQKLETRDEVEHEGWFLPACEEEDVSSLATQDGHINFDIRIIDEKKSVVQPPAVAPTGDPSMDRLPTRPPHLSDFTPLLLFDVTPCRPSR